MNRTVNYGQLAAQLKALTEGIPYETANLANAAALLWEYLPEINWAGFYKMIDGKLVLGPFQGKTACIVIPIGKGVCGTAVAQDKTQLVYDVHEFPGLRGVDPQDRLTIPAGFQDGANVIMLLQPVNGQKLPSPGEGVGTQDNGVIPFV